MKNVYKKLFLLNRSLLGVDNNNALEIINSQIPLKIYKFKSGQPCFDWTIPKEWKLKKAVLKDLNNNIIINAEENILYVLNYSDSFSGVVTKDELVKHIHSNPELPDSIPYRTSYYNKSWGFCFPHNRLSELTDDKYFVDIVTEFNDGYLNIGEATIKGKSEKTVVLSSYICHPHQANDGLSGVILLLYLYKMLAKEKKLKYTYKFYFTPETIGTITLLSNKIIDPAKIEYALISTCVGYGDIFNYKRTFLNNHSIDNVVEQVLQKQNSLLVDYSPFGSDERQYSSPKIEIPCASLMRTPYCLFKEYHTSFDNLDFISIDLIKKTSYIYREIILLYENKPKLISNTNGCEPFLSKHNLYRKISVPGHNDNEKINNWILHLSNGKNNSIDISKKSGYSLNEIERGIKVLIEKNIIKYD